MKTFLFNKRFWITAAIALLFCVPAKAQDAGQWSLIPYIRSGVAFDFMYNPIEGMTHADVGLTAKYNFNGYWSLLAGIEYEYRFYFRQGRLIDVIVKSRKMMEGTFETVYQGKTVPEKYRSEYNSRVAGAKSIMAVFKSIDANRHL